MNKLLPYPLFVLFSMISFNFTAIAVLLQIDFLEPHENITKAIAWLFAVVTWYLVYRFRNK
jgi:hypothetical protein